MRNNCCVVVCCLFLLVTPTLTSVAETNNNNNNNNNNSNNNNNNSLVVDFIQSTLPFLGDDPSILIFVGFGIAVACLASVVVASVVLKKGNNSGQETEKLTTTPKILWDYLDTRGTSSVGIIRMTRALEMTREEANTLMSRTDLNKDGMLQREEFFKLFPNADSNLELSISTIAESIFEKTTEEVLERSRHYVTRAIRFHHSTDYIFTQSVIKFFDPDRSGLVTVSSLMSEGQMTQNEANELCSRLKSQPNKLDTDVLVNAISLRGTEETNSDTIATVIFGSEEQINRARNFIRRCKAAVQSSGGQRINFDSFYRYLDVEAKGALTLDTLTERLEIPGNDAKESLRTQIDLNGDGVISPTELSDFLDADSEGKVATGMIAEKLYGSLGELHRVARIAREIQDS